MDMISPQNICLSFHKKIHNNQKILLIINQLNIRSMKASKRISLIFFLSVIMFIICISVSAVKHDTPYGFDNYGWPNIFFKIEYDQRIIQSMHFDFENFMIDYSIWLFSNSFLFLFIQFLKVKRKPAPKSYYEKEGLQKIRLKYEQSKNHSF